MIIPLNEKTRIRGTARCWQIEYLGQHDGEPHWEPKRYFLTFRQALERAADDEIRSHPARTIPDAIEAVSAISRKYGELFGINLSEADQHQVGIRQNLRGAA